MLPINSHNKLTQQYLTFLLKKEREEAEKIIREALGNGISIKQIYLEVFQPAQWEIGRLWQKNLISVALEHYCTAATQLIMSHLYEYIFTTEKNGMNLVSTSVSGELHELGIRMVTDFFEMEGWNTYYLGANTPMSGILEMVSETKSQVLAISATIYFNIPQVADLINFVRNGIGKTELHIIVGGKAFTEKQNSYKNVGADSYASNAQEAINKVNKVFNM